MRRLLVVPTALLDELEPLRHHPTFEVRTAASATEALALTAEWPPQLIILDGAIDGGDPRSACAAVRADQRLTGTRLLLVSRFLPDDEVGPGVLLAGADAHLILPIDDDVLLRTVGMLVNVQPRQLAALDRELLARVRIEARVELPARSMLANVLAVGEAGLVLECEESLVAGDIVRVSLSLPGRGPLEVRCMVLTSDQLQLHYGCELIGCTPEAREMIEELVARENA